MITGIFNAGKLDFGNHEKTAKAKRFALMHNGERFWLDVALPTDSSEQRKFYHGAVLALWAYLDSANYKSSEVINKYHDWAKIEFNGEPFVIKGKTHRIGGSTKGKLNAGYLERVINYLEENYAIDRLRVLDVKLYKKFIDEVFQMGEFDTFIEYMLFLGILELPEFYKK